MKTVKFVSYVHGPTTEEFGETQVLELDDIDRIVDQRLQVLNAVIDRLNQENLNLKNRIGELEKNREWLWGEIDLIKKFLVGQVDEASLVALRRYVDDGHTVLGGLDEAWKTRQRLDKLSAVSREIFAEVVQEVLVPKFEIFARQIEALEGVRGQHQVAL